MAAKQSDRERILQLEEEITTLTEELSQCQADKEFVWSLWKRLQVANPDITQAISLVVEREKHKAEAKDRKVLEILQVKDNKIHELEQRISGEQQEINNLLQRKITVDEENTLLKKELNDLQLKLKDKSQELKNAKKSIEKNDEQRKSVLENLKQENEGLNKRCADLLNDLDIARKQEAQWRGEKSGNETKIKDLETDLKEARIQMEIMHGRITDLASQLAVRQTELAQKNIDVTKLRQELQELQNLYKESNEHAAQQAELIQQLQALNMDTQKVLRNQEDAHTTETISYQKLYNDLNAYYETVKSTETQLRQNNIALTEQLHQKEEQISQLQVKLQETLSALPKPPQEPQDLEHPSLVELELIIASQKSEIKFLQDKLKTADFQLTQVNNCGSGALENSILRAGRNREVPPVKRSRSLSPKGFSREAEELKKLKIAEKRIEHLEKALQIKIQENAEIHKAHEKRRGRLIMLQTNYRAVKQQIENGEEGCLYDKGKNKRSQRAETWQLRHEDSDAVWNELAHFKRENKKLLVEKMNLEEEADQLKVQIATNNATIQELNVCLQNEREELLFRLGKDETVKSSTPKKNIEYTLQRALQKINHLERKLKELEMESKKLMEANEELIVERNSLKSSIRYLQKDADAREQKIEELIIRNQKANEARDTLEIKKDELNREVASLKRLLSESKKLRKENRDLLRQVQTLQSTLKQAKIMATKELNSKQHKQKEASTKVKHKAAKRISLRRHQAFLNQSIKVMSSMFENFNKDGWEDVSEDSDLETESFESLGQVIVQSAETACSSVEERSTVEENSSDAFTDKESRLVTGVGLKIHPYSPTTVWCNGVPSKMGSVATGLKDVPQTIPEKMGKMKKHNFVLKYHPSTVKGVRKEKRNNTMACKQGTSLASLRDRVATLQHQVAVLQKGKHTATVSANDFKKAKIQLAAELHLAQQRFQISKQMAKKLSSDLIELQQEKEQLEKVAEQMKDQLAQAKRSSDVLNQNPVTPITPSKNSDSEMKQLQSKLKNMTFEMTKQSSTIKSLKNEVQEKEEQIRELQERAARMERDVNMKRHLIEDLKSRLKTHQENERPSKEMLESLERKVKALTEECSLKKTSIDSLKQRLSVATKEKARYEQMYHKVQESLEKKNLKVTELEGKMTETERAMSELENTATQQLHNLAVQSEQSMEMVQNKLLHVNRRAEELVTFVKHLAKELQKHICDIRSQIRQAKILNESSSGPSKESVHRAQSLAASILNISCTDLEEILDVQDEEEAANIKRSLEYDKEWMNHIMKLLEGQHPLAPSLMAAVMDKLNERNMLLEELTSLKKDTR
ncbi:centlein [Discoglossus pictus]